MNHQVVNNFEKDHGSARAVFLERYGKWAALLRPGITGVPVARIPVIRDPVTGNPVTGNPVTGAQTPGNRVVTAHVIETRRMSDFTHELTCFPASIAFLEGDEPEATTHRIVQIAQQFASCPIIVAINRRVDAELRWLWMEAGACIVIDSIRQVDDATKIMQRHFAQVPLPEYTLEERIRNSLPSW